MRHPILDLELDNGAIDGLDSREQEADPDDEDAIDRWVSPRAGARRRALSKMSRDESTKRDVRLARVR